MINGVLDSTNIILLLVGCGVSVIVVSTGVTEVKTVLLGNMSIVNGIEVAAVENVMLGVSVWTNEVSTEKDVVNGIKMGVVDKNVCTELVANDRLATTSNVLDGCIVNDVSPVVEVVRNISSENDGVGVGVEVRKAVVVSSDAETDVETDTEGKNNSEENVAGGTKSSVDSEARLLEKVGVGVSIGRIVVLRKGVEAMVDTSSDGCTVKSRKLDMLTAGIMLVV
jgi:hypothetical protein